MALQNFVDNELPVVSAAWLNAVDLIKNITTGSATALAVAGDVSVATKTPTSAAATGVAGTITWDGSYLYVCVATDTWKRVAIATW